MYKTVGRVTVAAAMGDMALLTRPSVICVVKAGRIRTVAGSLRMLSTSHKYVSRHVVMTWAFPALWNLWEGLESPLKGPVMNVVLSRQYIIKEFHRFYDLHLVSVLYRFGCGHDDVRWSCVVDRTRVTWTPHMGVFYTELHDHWLYAISQIHTVIQIIR